MELECLLPDPSVLALRGVFRIGGTYHLNLEATSPVAACPGCGRRSVRVHSRYARHPDDLPVSGCRVRLELRVRKFFCDNGACGRSVFCERLPGVLAAYARRTLRLAEVLTQLALLVSARDARRVGAVLGLPGSASGYLRLAHAYVPEPMTATVVGVDDFAFRRGRNYGTLVVDLETHRPLDVLVGRSLEVIKAYLQQHPEFRVIARDRDASYAEAVRWAAPQAQVVLDRWHLLRNLAEAFERFVTRRHAAWARGLRDSFEQERGAAVEASTPELPLSTGRITVPPASELRRRAERQAYRQARFDRVHELHAAQKSKSEIARDTGLDWHTITSYLARDAPPDFSRRARTPSQLDPYAPHLVKRWGEGCRNAAQLAREISELGYAGNKRMVSRYVQAWRAASLPEAARAPPSLPSARALTWLLLRAPEDLSGEEAELLGAIEHFSPEATAVAELARRGLDVIRRRDRAGWEAWSEEIVASGCRELGRYLNGLANDQAALLNALSLPYSNGPTEGHVNRVKLIKRSMYGRASIELLRNKILYQAA